MPIIKIKTVESKVGWTNPKDPEHVSYDVVVDVNGRKAEARTFSHAIGEVGYEGEVETYEKKDHTYLKQVRTDKYVDYDNKPNFSKKPAYKDNSDGQRQGMCINNAANYINSQNKDYTPVEWAERVYRYADALYNLGDLKKEEQLSLDVPPLDEDASDEQLDLSEINKIFGK